MRVAIVGKRNAGKSTFVNALAGEQRVIASEMPGTTRDSVDVRFELEGRPFLAIDTAGVRKRKSVADDLEYYSIHRALRSIRRADVVLLMIDAAVPISQVDKRLSLEIQRHYKPCVIVLNKWDLVSDELKTGDYLDYLADALRGLDYAPIVFTSAINDDHVRDAVQLAWSLFEQANQRVSTGQLNQVVRQILAQRGPSSRLGTRAKVYYVTQPTVQPPTIVLFVNDPDVFTDQYQRYMINSFREMLPFAEVPIRLVIRPRSRRSAKPGEAPIAEA
jgi:GTP-binding protein